MASSRRRTLEQRLAIGGPKRILSIDGAGARGVLACGILAEVERRLALRSGRPDFRLSEYFDLIGGASTGAILAAGLAMGRTCAEVAELYRAIAPEAAAAKSRAAAVRRPRFDGPRLESSLARALGDHEMSSPALKTGLAIFTRRVDTGEAGVVTNHPRSKFWNGGPDGVAAAKRLVIRRIVQASAGAPALFDETRLKLDQDNAAVAHAEGAFIDTAAAGLNNPALELFKVATLKSHGFEWPTGEDQILLLSVGAGYWRPRLDPRMIGAGPTDEAASVVVRSIEALKSGAHDAGVAATTTLQSLSRPPRPWRIDGVVEEMLDDHLSPFPILMFQRMDARLERDELAQLAFDCSDAEIAQMREPLGDDGAVMARLHDVGLRTGQSYFRNPGGRETRDWDSLILPSRFDPAFFAERNQGQPKTRLDAMGRLFERPPGPGE